PCCGRRLCVPTLVPADAVPSPRANAPVPAQARAVHVPRPGTKPLRKAKALLARALTLGRFASPASLFVVLLLFPLPWIEVRCDRPIGNSESRKLADQSGLQAAYGGYSEAPLPHAARSERARVEAQIRSVLSEPIPSWSPLMVLYALVLLGGAL